MKRALAWLIPLGAIATFLSFPFPPPVVNLLAAEIIVALLVWSGLWFGARNGLGSAIPSPKRIAYSLLIGAAAGGVVLAALAPMGLQSRLTADAKVPAWKWLIIAFDAAVLEEIVFRLFIVSFVVWLLARFIKRPVAIWIALIVGALLFGAAHLGRWSAMGPAVITASMAVNAFAAIVLGLVYVKWGIEAAMITHFAADIVVHLIGSRIFA